MHKPDRPHREVYCRHLRVDEFERSAFIAAYKRHNESIMAYFANRPEDFLVIDWTQEEAWQSLCGFLDKPLPMQADGRVRSQRDKNKAKRPAIDFTRESGAA